MASVGKNLGQLASNFSTNLIQNPDIMKTQSLILASLALVISRVAIANLSAVQAHGTPEGPYRYRESIRTTIRETCAWVLSFGVLRFIQGKLMKPVMRKLLNITESPNPNPYSFFGDLKRLITGKKIDPLEVKLHESVVTQYHGNEFSKGLLNTEPVKKFIPWMYGKLNKETEEAFMKGLYKSGSIFLASIPTVIVAGKGLEWFTREYADTVVNRISKLFGHAPAKPQDDSRKQKPGQPTWPPTVALRSLAPQPQTWLSPAPQFFKVPTYPQAYAAAAAAFSGHGAYASKRQPVNKPIYPSSSMPSNPFAV